MATLIMGATGFLGKRVVKKFQDNSIPFVPMSKSLGVDFSNLNEFSLAVKNSPLLIDSIINCAALVGGIKYGLDYAADMYFVNSAISLNLFEIAKKYKINRVINPISNCSYPRDLRGKFKEDDWWNGELDSSVLVYGMARKMSYIQSIAYQKQYGIKTLNFIVPNMYGPEDHFDEIRSHALGALIKKISDAKKQKKDSVIIWGSGLPIREWLFVDDCAEFISLAIKNQSDKLVNLGCGEGISIKDLAEIIRSEIQYTGELKYDLTRPDGAPYKVMDASECLKIYSWKPPTSIKVGIRATIKWFNENS